MVYKYYYITFPNTAIYNKQECMFQYYVKKYGYQQYFTEMPQPIKIKLYNINQFSDITKAYKNALDIFKM